MIPGTTPTLRMALKDHTIDLSAASNVYVTLRQGSTEVTKTGEYIEITDGYKLAVWMTQEETLRFRMNAAAKVQVNWTYEDLDHVAKRNATKPREITITEQLLMRVIT